MRANPGGRPVSGVASEQQLVDAHRVAWRNVKDRFGTVHRGGMAWTPACQRERLDADGTSLQERRVAFRMTGEGVTCTRPECRRS